mmetsp:Transcript_1068/g.4061  ORF Transcript_1068/g.4061 Transcript_1068/m.4061 type:complete len:279 (-) Transcript_1068:4-840(-)
MMGIPDKTSDYLSPEYWNERFKTEEAYEWLGSYENFAPLIRDYLSESPGPPPQSVLVVGNGNSTMGQSVAQDARVAGGGPAACCITDISPVVVAKSRDRSRGGLSSSVSWAVCDMLRMPYRDSSFDLIVEKGAMDVLEVDGGRDPWNPNPLSLQRMHRWLSEAHRTLADSGVLISISFAQPHFRRLLYDAEGYTWIVETESYTTASAGGASDGRVADGGEEGSSSFWEYYVYYARKGGRSPLSRHQREGGASTEGCKEDCTHEILDSEDFLLHIGVDD